MLPFFFLTRGLRQMRRNSKENNFKAILETIRDVMNVAAIGNAVPEWLHDVFLGYGDAAAAHYKNLPTQIPTLDMVDTFLNGAHAASCFPGQQVVFQTEDGKAIADDVIPTLQPPFRATFSPVAGRHRRFLPVCEKRMNLRAAMVVCNPVYRMLSVAQRMTVTLPSRCRVTRLDVPGTRGHYAVQAAVHGSVPRGRAPAQPRAVHARAAGGHSVGLQPWPDHGRGSTRHG